MGRDADSTGEKRGSSPVDPAVEARLPIRPGQLLLGKYRITEVLGSGGMGVVTAAHHIQLDERVAIKLILPEGAGNRDRFLREARDTIKIKSERVGRVAILGAALAMAHGAGACNSILGIRTPEPASTGAGTGGSSATGTGGHTSSGGTNGSGGAHASSGGTNGSGGSIGTGGTSGPTVLLTPNGLGWIDASSNSLGVQGWWYGYGDAYGDITCGGMTCTDPTHGDHAVSECSTITAPPQPWQADVGFPQTTLGKMCTSGTAAKVPLVVNSSAGTVGQPDYANVWGAGIGFDLDTPQSGDACTPKGSFDATAKGVTGLQFDIDNVPTGLRVEFPGPATDNTPNGSDYWGGTPSYAPSPVTPGTNVITWDEVKPPGTPVATHTSFDPTHIESIQFHVPSSSAAVNYSFCISNVKLLM